MWLKNKGDTTPEPKGKVDKYAYRGTDLQKGVFGGIQRATGYGPGWLGIPPSGAAGMRYYGTVQEQAHGSGAGVR